jgi:hypothetical protein
MKQTSWRGALAFVLVCALFLVNNAATAAPARDDSTWHAEYFNSRDMSGTPALVREEATIDFDWKLGSPGPQVRADNFSARWTRTVKLEWSGNYRFYMTSDDGMRVWVDNILLIDQWLDRQDAWTTADIYLAEGNHTIKVEYYEHIGAALAKLVFQPEGDGTGGTWKSEYFTNPDLEGDPGLVLSDDHIAFNWGRGSPGEWIPADWFSARYTRDVIFAAGMYQFIVTTQGGVRLYVDDILILDQWDQVGQITYKANATLTAAVHRVRLEYTHTWRNASLYLSWQTAPTISGWKAEYFGTETPNTTPTFVRDDPAIDFDWGDNAPFVGMPREHWSARWTRMLNFASGYYRFTTVTDDGVRLWVDDSQLIDQWAPNDSKPFFGDIYLAAGPHTVKMEYYNLTGQALAHLKWQQMNTTTLTAILDDGDPGFTTGGAKAGWHTVYYGYGGRSRWTYNHAGYWARWTPALPRLGHYEVFVYIPWGANRTSARYYLKHEGDVLDFVINQRTKAGQWVSLGTFTFNADGTEFVHLEAATSEPADTRTVAFDAVKFVFRAP